MDTSSPDTTLCRLDEIPDGGATAVDLVLDGEAQSVIVLRHGDTARVFLNICPHAGRRLDYAPGRFLLKNDSMICAVHGATFEKASGLCVAGPCRGQHLRALAARVDRGVVTLSPKD